MLAEAVQRWDTRPHSRFSIEATILLGVKQPEVVVALLDHPDDNEYDHI